jgi:hypothetical protein
MLTRKRKIKPWPMTEAVFFAFVFLGRDNMFFCASLIAEPVVKK